MYGAETLPAITTGQDLIKASTGMMEEKKNTETKSTGVLAGSLGSLAKSMSLLVQSNLLQNEILLSIKDAILGTPSERRDEKIGAGDTDKPKGPGILSRVGSTLSKLNPFGGGGFMDTLLKLGLAVGGIALLKIFGDDMVPHLANMIKAFKEGTIGEKIGEIVTDIQEYLTPLWTKIKTKVGEFIDNVKLVFNLIVGAAKAIKDYMMQFDTSGGGPGGRYGDGKLDQFEKAKMIKDLKDKIIKPITDAVYGFAMGVVDAIILGIGAISIIKVLSRLSPLAVVPGGKPGKGNKPKGKISRLFKVAGLSKYGVAALGGVILMGIFAFAEDVTNAFNDQLDEEKNKLLDEIKIPDGKDDDPTFTERLSSIGEVAKGFLAKFIVGDQEGNTFMNVLENGFKKGLMGAAIGSITTVGFAALPGFIGGFIFGAVSAAFGEENVKEVLDGATDNLGIPGMILDYITDMYDRLILKPFEFIFEKLGWANDELMESLKKIGIDYGPKPKPKGFLTPYSDEYLYGPTANAELLAKKSNADLVDLLEKKKKERDDLQPVRSWNFDWDFGKYDKNLTGYEQKKLKGDKLIIKKLETELLERGINIDTAPGHLATGNLSKYMVPRTDPNVIKKPILGNYGDPLMNDIAASIDKFILGSKINSDNQIVNNPSSMYMFGGITPADPKETTKVLKVRDAKRSDIQLKEDIKLEGKSPSDINIYSFKYKGEEGRYEGVMAQEVPWASLMGDNGYLMVDYSKLDVEFKRIN